MIIAAFAGIAVALLRVADRREAERTAQRTTPGGPGVSPGKSGTTEPSAGFDRQPTGAPAPPATTPAKPKTSVTTDDEGPAVVLKGDGIGAFLFGADPDQVIAGLTLRWGPPDGDSGWVAATSSPYGPCPGTVVRGVNWRGFTVLFSDGATPRGPAGTRHFFTWEYQVDDLAHPKADKGGNRPALKTSAGVSVGATVKALQGAYGDRLELFTEEPAGVVRTIVSGGGCGE